MITDHSGDARKDPDQLEQEINHQRHEIDETIQALENKLSSREIMHEAIDYFSSHGREFATSFSNTVKANPIPVLLTSVGLAWLMMGDRNPPPPVLTDEYDPDQNHSGTDNSLKDTASALGNKASKLGAKARDAAHSAKAKANDVERSLKDKAASARERAADTAAKARDNFEYLVEEQPLVLGALGIAIGALVGGSLPRTATEDKTLGKSSDSVKHRGKEMAGKAYDKASQKAAEASEKIKQKGSEQGKPATRHSGTLEPSY